MIILENLMIYGKSRIEALEKVEKNLGKQHKTSRHISRKKNVQVNMKILSLLD